jgi:SAM-dependent methyltransferase
MRLTRLLGLSLLAAAALTTEIVLTRIYSVVLSYHFAFLAVSVSLFGLGFGGLALHILGRRLDDFDDALLTYAGAAMGAANGLLVVLLLTLRLNPFDWSRHSLLQLAAVCLASAAPFVAAGFFVALTLRAGQKRAGFVYLFDLVGAGLGCLLTIPLLQFVGGPAAVLVAGALAALGGVVAGQPFKPLRFGVGLVVAAVLLSVVGVHLAQNGQLLEPRYVKNAVEPPRLAVAWNSFSRVTAQLRPDVGDILLTADGVAHTRITPFTGDAASTQTAEANLQRLPYILRPSASTLIFGAGGGENVLTALDAGASQIMGVEYNPIVVDMVRRRFASVAGGLFSLPNVRVAVDEGRSFIRRTPEKFDIIQFTLIDTWAATAAGAFSLTENNVFTVEAMNEYFDHLRPGGLLSIKRWSAGRDVALRLVVLLKAVLQARGAREPERHFFIAHDNEFVNLMVKKEPFTLREMGDLVEQCARLNLAIAYSPFHPGDDPGFADLLGEADLNRWLAKQPYDLSPPTDDRPFLFYTVRLKDLPQVMKQAAGVRAHNIGPAMLLALVGLTALFVAALMLLPVWSTRDKQARAPLRWTAYFALLGMGCLLVEVATVQKFILYLGRPTYALAVVLFTLLLSSGVGAALSEAASADKAASRVRLLIAAIAFYAAAFMALSPRLFFDTLAAPLSERIGISVALLAPLGLLMGMPFPLGVRLVGADHPRAVPWMYAIASAGAVLGSAAATAIALHWGFAGAITAGLLSYVAACLLP